MSETFRIAKKVLCVGFIVAGTVALWLAPAMAQPLFVGGIAWGVVPE